MRTARSHVTRFLHLLLLVMVLHQVIGSQFMERPFPGDEPAWPFLLHEWVGIAAFGVLAAFWAWTLLRDRRETPLCRLLPWFSIAGWRAVLVDALRTTGRVFGVEPAELEADGALASAVHGLGLLVASAMALTGGAYFVLFAGTPEGKLVLGLHKAAANSNVDLCDRPFRRRRAPRPVGRRRNSADVLGKGAPYVPGRSPMKILIVEDDREGATFLRERLEGLGHGVDLAANGREGLFQASEARHDVIVLDRMLPELDGVSLVRMLRRAGVATPVLFLTNLSGIDDRVEGLEAGGDDYLVKPFSFSEFLARVVALARRPPPSEQRTVLAVADLEMDLIKRTVRRAGAPVELQPREFRLLEYLLRHEGRVVTRTMLLEHVWDFHFDPRTNIVETHISRLRAKVDRGQPVELIRTVRGAGYSLRVSP